MSSSVPCPISGVPAADPDLLGRFVEMLVRAAGGTIGPPLLLHLRASDGGIELATTPVDDLYAAVIGSDVADHWHGAGVLVAGRARAMVAPDDPRPVGEALGSAVSALVVWRDGTTASALSIDGGTPTVSVEEPDTARDERCLGRLVDVVRRSLRLPTAAPVAPVTELVTRLWLHRLLAVATAGHAVEVSTAVALEPPLPASWEGCRQQCASGSWPEIGVGPADAAWMDEGIFSREALAAFPDPAEVLAHLAELLPDASWQEIHALLAGDPGPRSN